MQIILLSLLVTTLGIILYKFLFGFFVPIAMIVFLGYTLKFLLKQPDIDLNQKKEKFLKIEDKLIL